MKKEVNVTWNDIERCCKSIFNQLINKNIHPTYIIAISRGGLIPGVILSHKFKADLATLPIKLYNDKREKIEDNDTDYKSLTLSCVREINEDDNVLIIDDIFDSGETLEIVGDWFSNNYSNRCVLACLYSKQHREDMVYVNYTKSWVVFPYEKM